MLLMTQNVNTPRVVIVGGGFAGLNAAKSLANAPVQVTLVDRKNHHTFQPLLYQVALAVLSPAEIASPVRAVLRGARNVEVLLGEVTGFDLEKRQVMVDCSGDSPAVSLPYDYLIVASGATHAYFGHPEWAQVAPGLKTLEDAIEIRRRVLMVFENAEREAIAGQPETPLNFVVIGAGPTGVELAGAIADISKRYMKHDFRAIDPRKSRIILLEGGPRVLAAYPEDLSRSAERQLKDMGVEVRTNAMVTNVAPGEVRVGAEKIPATVVLWSAGVAASPLGKMLGVPVDRAGRVQVEPDLSVLRHPEVMVIGDLAAVHEKAGTDHIDAGAAPTAGSTPPAKMVPGVAPAAIQMGKFAARQIKRDLSDKPREEFHYLDKGQLATIGRSRAVGDFGRIHVSGYFAWLAWLFIHLFFLIGFRNRLLVMMEWAWAYVSYKSSARLITGEEESRPEQRPQSKAG
jgi:NADH:quinone reductase (non-electrogenic)